MYSKGNDRDFQSTFQFQLSNEIINKFQDNLEENLHVRLNIHLNFFFCQFDFHIFLISLRIEFVLTIFLCVLVDDQHQRLCTLLNICHLTIRPIFQMELTH